MNTNEYILFGNNQIGVTVDVLVDVFKIPLKTILNGLSLYKTKQSKNWAYTSVNSIKYVIINRIAQNTIKNYQVSQDSNELIRVINNYGISLVNDNVQENILLDELIKNCLEQWPRYVDPYLEFEQEERQKYALIDCALHFCLYKIKLGLTPDLVHRVICSVSNSKHELSYKDKNGFHLDFNPGSSKKYFKEKLLKGEEHGFQNILLHGNRGRISEKRIPKVIEELVIALCSTGVTYKLTKVAKRINNETDFKISYRSVRRIHQNHLELCKIGTKGIANAIINRMPYFFGRKPDNIGDYAESDGTRWQFVVRDNNGELTFYRTFTILDGHSGLPTSCIGPSENVDLVLGAWKLFVREHGFLPREIIHDGASPFRTERFEAFKSLSESWGVLWRPIPKTSTGLALVERYHHTMQTRICNGRKCNIGEGVTSKGDRSRPSSEIVKIYRNESGDLLSIQELTREFYKCQREFRDDLIFKTKTEEANARSAQTKWNQSTPINAVKISPVRFIQLFGEIAIVTVRKGVVSFTGDVGRNTSETFNYSIYDTNLFQQCNEKKVIVRYDPQDMSKAYLFSSSEKFLGAIDPSPVGEKTKWNQSQETSNTLKLHFDRKDKLVKEIGNELSYFKEILAEHDRRKIPIEVLSVHDQKDLMDDSYKNYFEDTCDTVRRRTEDKRRNKGKGARPQQILMNIPASMKDDSNLNAKRYANS